MAILRLFKPKSDNEMREKQKKGIEKRPSLANSAILDLFFPLLSDVFSHPIHNPLTFISNAKI